MAAIGFEIDIRTSQTLHESLCRLKQECTDSLVKMSVTQMLMAPMQPADHYAAGTLSPEQRKHFALNIPFYARFTSPIRRYPDVIVHRLLQATLDESVDKFELSVQDINMICNHCNEMRMASKKAQRIVSFWHCLLGLTLFLGKWAWFYMWVVCVLPHHWSFYLALSGGAQRHANVSKREQDRKEAASGTDLTPTGPVIDSVDQKHGNKKLDVIGNPDLC
ncbi:hypothetical protein ACA910_008509 [Epithemia clementina (nom. ined.)]